MPLCVFAYNPSLHKATGHTIITMVFGREARMPTDMALPQPSGPAFENADYVAALRDGYLQIQRAAQNMECSRLRCVPSTWVTASGSSRPP